MLRANVWEQPQQQKQQQQPPNIPLIFTLSYLLTAIGCCQATGNSAVLHYPRDSDHQHCATGNKIINIQRNKIGLEYKQLRTIKTVPAST